MCEQVLLKKASQENKTLMVQYIRDAKLTIYSNLKKRRFNLKGEKFSVWYAKFDNYIFLYSLNRYWPT